MMIHMVINTFILQHIDEVEVQLERLSLEFKVEREIEILEGKIKK